MLPIQKKLIKYNFSSGNNPKYIVVHDTGNMSKGADAEAHFKYFNSGDRQASAHYFVDDHSIVQTIEDYNASWHCGDGKGQYGITNYNSIGIEICINSDGDYDKAVGNAIDLVKYLIQKYSIPIDKVVRHYDASKKNCPGTMSANNWAKWTWFKTQLSKDSWKFEGINGLADAGLLSDREGWCKKIDEPMPVWAVTLIMYRIFKNLKGGA
ncbi:MAG: N-acetylmuramoyl-L-alanine amidase [Firmicutes bacterium]|nr:N-acetylmuramoyl-L-alanine amidase [Bacillota bacterium]